MSFRDNLQHLRATRNMTQEQLAMLLGVSRQSVTKWEAEKSYPEMDKLLKMCNIFDCTLDDLVSGDLTNRTPDAAASVPAGPATDVCGYDRHMRSFANRISLGVALVIMGAASCGLIEGLYANTPFAPATLFVWLVAGLALIIPAGLAHADFARQHPFIEDFYTEADRSNSMRELGIAIAVGVAVILLGNLVPVFADGTWFEDAAGGVLLVFVAAGVWCFVRWGILHGRLDLDAYNKERALKSEEQSAEEKRTGAICGIIMLVVTVVALVWLFLGAVFFGRPDPDQLSLASFFWLPWPVGGIACAIVSIYRSEVARR